MKILLTGATGLLGNALGEMLVARGHEVTAISRQPESAKQRVKYKCRLISWDEDANLLADIQALVHLAGEGIADHRWTTHRKNVLHDSRIRTACMVLELLREARLQVVITASGVGIYGDGSDRILTESSPPGIDFVARLCVDWEEATKNAKAERWVALRTAPVLSAQGGFLQKLTPIFRIAGASRLGSGRQFFPWIHIQDWVALTLWCIENEQASGAFNAAAPTPVTNAEFTELLKKALRTYPNLPIPKVLLKAAVGEMASVLLASQRAVPKRALQLDFQFRFSHLASALRNIYGSSTP